jgi:spermidine/putrescine transport system ATP-binding protein
MANSKVSQDTGDLVLNRVSKFYGDFCAVDDLSLTVPDGSFFALLGPSGCGKTTTLRMIAGLEEPSQGTIHIGDTDITTQKPYRRNVNTVFQNYALFPHLTIFENIAFGLRRRGLKDVKTEVENALNLVRSLTAPKFSCLMNHLAHLISSSVARCRLSSSASRWKLGSHSYT